MELKEAFKAQLDAVGRGLTEEEVQAVRRRRPCRRQRLALRSGASAAGQTLQEALARGLPCQGRRAGTTKRTLVWK